MLEKNALVGVPELEGCEAVVSPPPDCSLTCVEDRVIEVIGPHFLGHPVNLHVN